MNLTLLTDYGRGDEFVGVCHGVIRRIVPDVQIVDVTHGISRHDVRHGAISLRNALPYLPVGVHVAIVDPQVGTERRGVAVRCEDGNVLVGPDNGVLSLAWERAGGVAEAIDITRSSHRLEPVSATFHGRDVFAPVAARLALGASLEDAGESLDHSEIERLGSSEPEIDPDGSVRAHVTYLDRFGNAALDLSDRKLAATALRLGHRVAVTAGGQTREAAFSLTFADVPPGELIVYRDSYGAIALAVNRGSAAGDLAIGPGDEVGLRPA
jgi:S-adenosyl-L-methionine hydrolase (adenosine-forming)